MACFDFTSGLFRPVPSLELYQGIVHPQQGERRDARRDLSPQFRAQDAEGRICIVKNLNDGHRAIGEAVIILTRSLKQFRFGQN